MSACQLSVIRSTVLCFHNVFIISQTVTELDVVKNDLRNCCVEDLGFLLYEILNVNIVNTEKD